MITKFHLTLTSHSWLAQLVTQIIHPPWIATTINTHTSNLFFSTPYPSPTSPKQCCVSPATPASECEVPAFKFCNVSDNGLPSPSDEFMSRSTISQAPHTEKKAHKKWTMKEMQMLVKGCNCISVCPSFCGVSHAHFASQSMALATGKWSSMLQVYILTIFPLWTSKISEFTVVSSNCLSSSPPPASALISLTCISSITLQDPSLLQRLLCPPW